MCPAKYAAHPSGSPSPVPPNAVARNPMRLIDRQVSREAATVPALLIGRNNGSASIPAASSRARSVSALKILWSLVHRDKPQRMTQTCSPRSATSASTCHGTSQDTDSAPVDKRHLQVNRNRVLRFTLLSVCCFRPPLLGSSYSPCDSNTPRSPRVPHRSGSLRQSQASAARAKPEPSADLGSARANRLR